MSVSPYSASANNGNGNTGRYVNGNPNANTNVNASPSDAQRFLHLKGGNVDLKTSPSLENQTFDASSNKRSLYIVQFKDVITEKSKQVLTAAGAEVGDYVPDFAYLVRINGEQAQQIASSELVYGVTPYQADWKGFNSLSEYETLTTVPDTYIITVFKGSATSITSTLNTQATTNIKVIGDSIEAKLTTEQLQQLLQHEDVLFIEPKLIYDADNDFVTGQLKASSPNGLWSRGLTGTGQVVGVADSGLDTGNEATLHRDFTGKLHTTPIDYGGDNDWSDPNGHGTHVAGTVLGIGTESNGKYKGVAHGAKLVFQSLQCADGNGFCYTDIRDIFRDAQQAGASIHTNSWSGRVNEYNSNAVKTDEFLAQNKSFTILFSAGNRGPANDTVNTPSGAKNVLTVGNLLKSNPNTIRSSSSRGNTSDGRIKPDVVATGSDIISARSSVSSNTPSPNEFYTRKSGTSMSTPAVAGAATLVRQFYTTNKNITPSSALIKGTLINGAQDVGYGWGSRETGWGRVDLEASLFPTNNRKVEFVDQAIGLGTGESSTHQVTVQAGQPLKISTVWTDHQGTELAAKALVNDLDIEVKAPDGQVFKGNCFVSNAASTSCASADRLNNVENVYIPTPQAGTYTVTIKGFNVPQSKQPYALVVSGHQLTLQ
ncbi:S8 family serine peptidase [Paenibacillus sp. 481]|nr:S8 family serine peptidase [Paenibacillus sp. 481]